MSILSAVTTRQDRVQQQEQRFNELSHMAAQEGLIGQSGQAPMANGLKTGFMRLIDMLLRPNYAVAGAWDVLQGTSDTDETVGGRILRELFSGVGPLKGDKEVFGDVLEQGGYGEGGRLSDVIGENWLTERLGFDPTFRGTAALAMDIFLDPTTYITFGSNAAMQVVTRGGKAGWMTKAAAKPVREAARARWLKMAKGIDMWEELGGRLGNRQSQLWVQSGDSPRSWWRELDEAIRVGDDATENTIMKEIEERMISRESQRMIRTDAYQMREGWLHEKIKQAAREDVFKLADEGIPPSPDIMERMGITAAEASKLIANKRLRWMGRSVPGASEPLARGFDALKTQVDNVINSSAFLRASKAEASKVYNAMGQFFNRDWALRNMPGVKVYMQTMRNNTAEHHSRIRKNMDAIFGKNVTTDDDFWHKLTRAMDNPADHMETWVKAAEEKGFDEAWAFNKIDTVKLELRRAVDLDVHLGLLDPKLVRQHYIPHQTSANDMLTESTFTEFLTGQGKPRYVAGSGSVGGYAEPRIYDTLDEFEEAIAKFKEINPDAEIDIVLDPRKLIEDRLRASARAWERKKFINRLRTTVKRNYLAELRQIVETEMPHLRRLIDEAELDDEGARTLLNAFETEMVYWKQPTARLVATGDGSIRVEQAPADARAPKFRRARTGEDGQTQMVRDAVKRMIQDEYEKRPAVMAARDLFTEASEAEALRADLAGRITNLDDTKRLVEHLKRDLVDEDYVTKLAEQGETRQVAIKTIDEAIASMRASLADLTTEAQEHTFALAKDDIIGSLELVMGRELQGLRELEDSVRVAKVLDEGDDQLWDEYVEWAAREGVDKHETLEGYHAWLGKRSGHHLGEIQKVRNAQQQLTDTAVTARPLTERNTDEWTKALKGQARAYMDVDDERLAGLGVKLADADTKLAQEITEGAEPLVGLRYEAPKASQVETVGAELDLVREATSKNVVPSRYSGVNPTDDDLLTASAIIYGPRGGDWGSSIHRSVKDITDEEIARAYELIGRGDKAMANAAIELLQAALWTKTGVKPKTSSGARQYAARLHGRMRMIAEAGGEASFTGRAGRWVPSTPQDAKTLAAYGVAGKRAKIKFVGKGSQSPQAQQDLAQTLGRSRGAGDLGTATPATLARAEASRAKIIAAKTPEGKPLGLSQRARDEVDKIETEIDKIESDVAQLERTAAQKKKEFDVVAARVRAIEKSPKGTKVPSKLHKEHNTKKEAWESANHAYKDAEYHTGIKVRQLQKRVKEITKTVDEVPDVAPKLDHAAKHKQFQAERMRIQQAMDERAALAARRDEIHRNHIFRQEDAATDVAALSAKQRDVRKRAAKTQRKLHDKLATVRESLKYSLELQQELMERRRANKHMIKRYRDKKRAIRAESAPLERARSEAFEDRKILNKQARELLKGERKLHKRDLEAVVKADLLASTEDVRGTFVYGMLSNIEGLRELEGFLQRWGEVVDTLRPGMLARMGEATNSALQQTIDPRTGQKWVDVWVGRTKSVTDIKDARALALEETQLFNAMTPAQRALADGDVEGLDDLLDSVRRTKDWRQMSPDERQARLDELIAQLNAGTEQLKTAQQKRKDFLAGPTRGGAPAAPHAMDTTIPPEHIRAIEPGKTADLASVDAITRRDTFIEATRTGEIGPVLTWAIEHTAPALRPALRQVANEIRPALDRIQRGSDPFHFGLVARDVDTQVLGYHPLTGPHAAKLKGKPHFHIRDDISHANRSDLTLLRNEPDTMGLQSGRATKPGGPVEFNVVLREAQFNSPDAAASVVHELVHASVDRIMALTDDMIHRGGAFPADVVLTEDALRGANQMRALFKMAAPLLRAKGIHNAGAYDLHEFIAYGLTDPATIKVLKSITRPMGDVPQKLAGQGDTMWGKFLGAIRRMMGLSESGAHDPATISLWDELLATTSVIARSPLAPKTAQWARAQGSSMANVSFIARDIAEGVSLRRPVTHQRATTSTIAAARQKAATGRRPQLEHWRVPHDLADAMKQLDKIGGDTEEARNLLKLYDIALNSFKELVTVPFPAFHFRNAYANVAAVALHIRLGALNPIRHKEAIDILMGAEGTLKLKDGSRMTYGHMRSLLDANDMVPDAADLLEMTGKGTGRRSLGVGNNRVTRPIRQRYLNPMTNVGKGIESEARALYFIDLIRNGADGHHAGEQVKRVLFDYANLSDKEKTYMRRIFPFYTWQSKNIRQQVRNLYERPGMVSAQAKPLRDRGPENDALPEYLRGELQVRLEGDYKTPVKRLTNIDLPISELSLLWQGSLDKTFMGFLNQMNPLLKAPLEVAFNMDTFNGRTVNGRQWMGRNGPMLAKFPGWFQDAIELQEVQRADGTTGYTANGTKTHLLFKTWAVSRIMNTAGTAQLFRDPSASPSTVEDRMFAFWKLMTGMEFREYDMSEFQKEVLRNRIDRLEQELLDRGVLRKFQKVYSPAAANAPIGAQR